MSIIHFSDTSMAASDQSGKLVYPLGGWSWSAGNGSYYAESVVVILYGEGARAGEYDIIDFGILEESGVWLTEPEGVEDWLIRSVDVTLLTGNIPGQQVDYPGQWTGYRTDWRALGSGTGIVEISSDTSPDWNVSDGGQGGEDVLGRIEFSKYPRDTVDVTFDAANVNTTLDTITITGHGFVPGDQAVYIIPNGETGIAGTGSQGDTAIVDNEFLSIYVIDSNTIKLASNLSGADDTTSLFNLTGTGTGTGHILRKIVPASPTNVGGSNIIDISANA